MNKPLQHKKDKPYKNYDGHVFAILENGSPHHENRIMKYCGDGKALKRLPAKHDTTNIVTFLNGAFNPNGKWMSYNAFLRWTVDNVSNISYPKVCDWAQNCISN